MLDLSRKAATAASESDPGTPEGALLVSEVGAVLALLVSEVGAVRIVTKRKSILAEKICASVLFGWRQECC